MYNTTIDTLRGDVRSAKMLLKTKNPRVGGFNDSQSKKFEEELKGSVNRGEMALMYYDGCFSKINIGNADRWVDCYCLVPKGFDRHSWDYSKPHWADVSVKIYGVVYIAAQNNKLYKHVV